MGFLGALRVGIGTAISRVLAWIFAHDWPRKLLAHGLSPETKRRLAREIAPEALPDRDVAHAYLVKTGPAVTKEVVLATVRHDFPELRPELASELTREARTRPAELDRIEAVVRDVLLNQERTLAYAYHQAARLRDAIEHHGGGLAGKKALELGPGHSLVIPTLLLAGGLESYVGVDLFPIASQDPAIKERVRADVKAWGGPVHAGSDLATRKALDEAREKLLERLELAPKRLELRCPVDAAKLPLEDGRFDLCFSKSAFEHFQDAASAARESVRVLAPRGVGLHEIDLRDHRDFARPREFLRWDPETWTSYFDEKSTRPLPPELGPRRPAFDFTNRLRLGDFTSAFRAAGASVEVVTLESKPVSDEERATFHASFRDRSREDLETLVVLLVVRKSQDRP